MAEARREPIPAPVETKIVLELTEEEASVLLRVANKIGGDPTTTRRGSIENIRRALCSVRVTSPDYTDKGCTGNIFFND